LEEFGRLLGIERIPLIFEWDEYAMNKTLIFYELFSGYMELVENAARSWCPVEHAILRCFSLIQSRAADDIRSQTPTIGLENLSEMGMKEVLCITEESNGVGISISPP
jgi:hypothetical protein